MPEVTAVFDLVGYKTGPERADTAYAAKGETFEVSEAEYQRLSDLGAIKDKDADDPEAGLVGDAVFLDPNVDPAGRPVDQERTDDEFARPDETTRPEAAATDETDPSELKGAALDEAVRDAGIEGASSMTADEKREALAAYRNGEETSPDDS